jgi:hypothetical protein
MSIEQLRNLRAFWAVIVLHLLMAICANAAVTESFLDRVAMIESSGDQFAIGDNGRSVGRYQIGLMAWCDVNEIRASKGLKTYPYSYATNATVSRIYARQYLHLLASKLRKHLGRAPTASETYSAYNMGFSAFKKRGLNLSKVPSTTKRNIAKLERQK